jgi:hypothetical protein
MTWFSLVGLISAIALFLPIIIILTLRLAWYKSFPALLVYYLLVFAHSIMSLDFVKIDNRFVYYFGVLNNFMDAPLMLTFMTYFSKTAEFRNRMKLIIPVFVLFELIIVAVYGFNIDSAIIVMAPGLLLVLAFSLLFFIHQAKITVIYQKAVGKAFIAAALLFAYGGYSFIYIVYYLFKTPYKADTMIVFYLVTIFSSMLLAAGIFYERRRVSQLNELQVAREELKVIYGGS